MHTGTCTYMYTQYIAVTVSREYSTCTYQRQPDRAAPIMLRFLKDYVCTLQQ